jgi:hypothetical protein
VVAASVGDGLLDDFTAVGVPLEDRWLHDVVPQRRSVGDASTSTSTPRQRLIRRAAYSARRKWSETGWRWTHWSTRVQQARRGKGGGQHKRCPGPTRMAEVLDSGLLPGGKDPLNRPPCR